MSDWGDEIERKHFEGDFLGAMARGPRKVEDTLKAVLESGMGLNGAAQDLGHGADSGYVPGCVGLDPGWEAVAACFEARQAPMSLDEFVKGTPGSPSARASANSSEALGQVTSGGSSSSTSTGKEPQVQRRRGPFPDEPDSRRLQGMEPEQQVEYLKARLQEEQDAAAERARLREELREDIARARSELEQEHLALQKERDSNMAWKVRAAAVERGFETLQENHELILEQNATLSTERRQHLAAAIAAAAASDRAAQLAAGGASREWARDGPEVEALKDAKLHLAEVLAEADEARLVRRKELARLYEALEQITRENDWRRGGGADRYKAPNNSFVSSLGRLLSVARGRGDPYPSNGTAVR